MAASKTDILNLALQNLGARRIISPLEDTREAEVMNGRYDFARRRVLECAFWHFALKRVALNQDPITPAFGYLFQYQLPADLVRMVGTETQLESGWFGNPDFNGFITISNSNAYANADRYKIENGFLLSNDGTVKILYVFDQEDTSKFSNYFVDMLGCRLAADTAIDVTNSAQMAQALEAKFSAMERECKVINSQQGTYERIETSAFLAARW